MIRVVSATAVAIAALAVALSAVAALPATRASFGGVTSEKKVNGFRGLVTFTAGQNGATLRGFGFQTLGCFGFGSVALGVDPYVLEKWTTPTVPVTKYGTILATVNMTSREHPGDTMSARIKAAFTNKTTLKGTIRVNLETLKENGATCGPYAVKFDAFSPKRSQTASENNLP